MISPSSPLIAIDPISSRTTSGGHRGAGSLPMLKAYSISSIAEKRIEIRFGSYGFKKRERVLIWGFLVLCSNLRTTSYLFLWTINGDLTIKRVDQKCMYYGLVNISLWFIWFNKKFVLFWRIWQSLVFKWQFFHFNSVKSDDGYIYIFIKRKF